MKKVLFVTYDFPYPTNSGGKSRAFNLIKFGKSLPAGRQGENIEILLFSFTRQNFKKSYEDELEKIGVLRIFTEERKKAKDPLSWGKTILGRSSIFKLLYFDRKIEEKLIEIVRAENVDTVLFESFYTSFYISGKLKQLGVKQIFGTENIEHILYYDFAKEKASIIKKPYMIQVGRVRSEEELAYRKSDAILAVTEEEKDYIEKRTKTPVFVIPNGVDTKEFSFKNKSNPGQNLLFVGNFSYFPNVDAMKFFYTQVFTKIPEAKLTINGKHQDKLPFVSSDNRIKSIDHIDKIQDAYYDADIFVFPVRHGGGTNFKILEAASCGTPIVAMSDRVKGLGFVAGKHYAAANTAAEFIGQVQKLIEDKELGEELAKNARSLVEKEYSWENIGKKLRNILDGM